MKYHIPVILAALLAVLSGCVSTPERPVQRLIMPELEAPKELQTQRISEFRKLTEKVGIRGIGIHLSAIRRATVPADEVLERIKAMGFNRIYCYVSSEVQLDGTFRDFIAAANKRNLPVEAVLNQRDFYFRSTGNRIIRFFRPNYLRIDDAVEALVKFDDSSSKDEKLAGVTVFILPHLFTATDPDTPPDSLYYWNERTFGDDLDNARLMKDTLERLRQSKAKAGHLPFSCAMADFYHELAEEGKLPLGRISDFCAISSRVMLLDSGNKPSAAARVVENELAAIPKGCSAMVGINLAGHTSVDSGALRRRDWNDLMRAMRYLLGRFERHPSFEGFVLAPFSALEFLRTERD